MKDIGYFGLDIEVGELSPKQAAKLIVMMCQQILGPHDEYSWDGKILLELPNWINENNTFDNLVSNPIATIKWATQYRYPF